MPAGYRAAGAHDPSTVLVQEGGYDVTTIGAPGAETLGVQGGMTRA
jgi:hypothetical protein